MCQQRDVYFISSLIIQGKHRIGFLRVPVSRGFYYIDPSSNMQRLERFHKLVVGGGTVLPYPCLARVPFHRGTARLPRRRKRMISTSTSTYARDGPSVRQVQCFAHTVTFCSNRGDRYFLPKILSYQPSLRFNSQKSACASLVKTVPSFHS